MKVVPYHGESSESLVRRFIKKIKKTDLMDQLWENRHYKKPSQIEKEKEKARLRTLEKLKEEMNN